MQISCLLCKQHVVLRISDDFIPVWLKRHTHWLTPSRRYFPTIFCLVLRTNIVIYNAKKKLYKKLWTRAWILTFLCLFEKGKKNLGKKLELLSPRTSVRQRSPCFRLCRKTLEKVSFNEPCKLLLYFERSKKVIFQCSHQMKFVAEWIYRF